MSLINGSASIINDVNKVYLRGYVATKLPLPYFSQQYLENNDNTYAEFDTSFVTDNFIIEFEIDVKNLSVLSEGVHPFIQVYNSSNNEVISIKIKKTSSSSVFNINVFGSSTITPNMSLYNYGSNYYVKLTCKNGRCEVRTMNGTKLTYLMVYNYYNFSTGNYKVSIFGNSNTQFIKNVLQLNFLNVHNENTITFNGIPAHEYNSNQAGLYDLVNDDFITAITGSFISTGDNYNNWRSDGTYAYNQDIVTLDLCNIPFLDNDASLFAWRCTNLSSITNMNDDIERIHSSFGFCSNLTTIDRLPSKLYDMEGTFQDCTSLTNIPSIPNSVYILSGTFSGCTSLVNAPVIPNSISTMSGAFMNCTSLVGNIIVESNHVTNAEACFYGTTGVKNVYIPYKYSNDTYTTTYNSFINAGYDENGTKEGVYLKDIDTYNQ